MTKTDFMEWAARLVMKIDEERFFSYSPVKCERAVICYDMKTGKAGVARCHPKDKFIYTVGKAIAYARCKEIEIPKIHEEKYISAMKYGDRFYAIAYPYEKVEYTFLGRTPNIPYIEWIAFATSNPNRLEHFRFDKSYEMVE